MLSFVPRDVLDEILGRFLRVFLTIFFNWVSFVGVVVGGGGSYLLFYISLSIIVMSNNPMHHTN